MAPLPNRPLGKDGPQVTAIGYGLMGLSAFYGEKKPDPERLAVLDKLYEIGERNWDSADIYGDSEDLVGQWFAKNPEKRKDIFLATKFGARTLPDWSAGSSDPAYCKTAFARSLARLRLPYVDLYYCHRLDGKTPIEKTVQAMAELKAEGKIKHLGLSECSAASLRRAHAVHPIAAVQIEYSPFTLDIEHQHVGLLKACRELGVAVVAYSPIGRGMLSGRYRSPDDFEDGDFRKQSPRFSKENFPQNLKLVDRLTEIAKAKGCTPTQLTLAWLLAQGDDIIPIPGSTNLDRIQENLGSLKVKLTADEEKTIRKLCEEADIGGDRYPDEGMKGTFVDTPEL